MYGTYPHNSNFGYAPMPMQPMPVQAPVAPSAAAGSPVIVNNPGPAVRVFTPSSPRQAGTPAPVAQAPVAASTRATGGETKTDPAKTDPAKTGNVGDAVSGVASGIKDATAVVSGVAGG